MRGTLFLLIVGLGGAGILIALGVWQVQRLAWKEGVIADINARIVSAPAALPASPDREADAYLPVRAAGTLDTGFLRVLVSQKTEGAGYRIIAPFALTGGRRVMADLGFLPVDTAEFQRPNGQITITGNLQWPDETDGFTPAPDREGNIWFARDVDLMAEALSTEALLLVARAVAPPIGEVTPLPVDTSRIPNNHLQYAVTWFSLAVIWLAMSLYFYRRRAETRATRSADTQ
ncbi:MAG: SURF1 family protein [Pseudomonadota bacterium]